VSLKFQSLTLNYFYSAPAIWYLILWGGFISSLIDVLIGLYGRIRPYRESRDDELLALYRRGKQCNGDGIYDPEKGDSRILSSLFGSIPRYLHEVIGETEGSVYNIVSSSPEIVKILREAPNRE
jgi:hypothetical protein